MSAADLPPTPASLAETLAEENSEGTQKATPAEGSVEAIAGMPTSGAPAAGKAGEKGSAVVDFLVAVQFLTISPPLLGGKERHTRLFTPAELGRSVGYYPLVGIVLGVILFALDMLFELVFPIALRSAIVLALWVILTGALHLDGFLDACDGLLGGFTPEQRLHIMRDERVGAYALAGGILLLLVQWNALSAVPHRFAALVLAPTLGRWVMALAVARYPYARPSGLGRDIKDHTGRSQVVLATLFVLAGVILAAWSMWPALQTAAFWLALTAWAGAALTLWLGARFTLRHIPGLTGDIYGALNVLAETVVLLALVAGRALI